MKLVNYRMRNRINGRDFKMDGQGVWTPDGTIALNLVLSDIPASWSGAVGPCICSGPSPGEDQDGGDPEYGGLVTFAPNGYRTTRGTLRRATLWDAAGDVIASVSATGNYQFFEDRFDFDINVETETRKGSIIGELVSVDHYSFALQPVSEGRFHVLSHYSLSTADGRRARGITSIHYSVIGESRMPKSVVVGRNEISVQQVGRNIQYISCQSTIPEPALGLPKSTLESEVDT
jgi:hypothetical protein